MKTWIIRILLFLIAVVGVSLFVLSMLGGTSETHRTALEQAFSEFLKADIRIGKVEKFNIIPQMTIDLSDIKGRFAASGREFEADHAMMVFGFADLMAGARKIEDLRLENFRTTDSAPQFRIDRVGIENSELTARGAYNGKALDFSLPLKKLAGSRPSYSLEETRSFTAHYGSLEFKGQSDSSKNLFESVDVFAGGTHVAQAKGRKEAGDYKIHLTCAAPVPSPAKEDMQKLAVSGFFPADENCLK